MSKLAGMQRSPSNHQQENLARMTAILASNWKACILASSLWDFFNFKLYCIVRDRNDEPNRIRIGGITSPTQIDDVLVSISIQKTDRQEEGLVHELLHANLIPLGYPKFWIDEKEPEKRKLAKGIINNAEHVPMLKMYLAMGYARDRFLGSSELVTPREKRVIGDIEKMEPELTSPDRFASAVSRYLQDQKIKATPLYLAEEIVRKRVC